MLNHASLQDLAHFNYSRTFIAQVVGRSSNFGLPILVPSFFATTWQTPRHKSGYNME
jgi:hypothetical protein